MAFKNQKNGFFKPNEYVEITENKKDRKKILNYECYKVILKEKQTYVIGNLDYSEIFKDKYIVIVTEMYETTEIKCLFHPLIFDKSTLKKYYPLEIKINNDLISGKEKLMTTQCIILLQIIVLILLLLFLNLLQI